jgi:ribosomal protein S18 acetylase RimI-like enzyme
MPQPGLPLVSRSFQNKDVAEVLDMINADQLPGQPPCTDAMLSEAVAGRSPVDSGWWNQLDHVAVDVLCDPHATIQGVVSYARRQDTDSAVILWLHGREDPTTVNALVRHARARLTGVETLDAFEFASALAVGLEGLPVRHRPATRAALAAHGFLESNLWRYMHRDLPAPELPLATHAQVSPDPNNPGWLIQLRQPDRADGPQLGEAQVSIPAPGLGVLWWISIDPAHRGQYLGRQLLGSALDALHRQGAHEVILFVDDDAPPHDPERGRGAANALYDKAGFVEVDRLCSYRRDH